MSVKRRGKKWAATAYNPARARNEWVGTFPTKQAARIAEGRAIEEFQNRRRLSTTVKGFSAMWLEEFPRPKQSTNIVNRQALTPFVKEFGNRELGSISRSEARSWALKHRAAAKTVRTLYADAVRVDLVDRNPFSGLGLPGSRGRKDIEMLSREQVTRLAQIARAEHGPPFHAMVQMAAYTGMRPGELFALRWPNVDFEGCEVRVAEAFSSASRTFTAPKNGRERTIVLPPPARTALLGLGRGDGLVWTTGRRGPWSANLLHYRWEKVRCLAGLPDLSFYFLRHYCAAYMLNELELPPQDVAHQLGHTDGGVLVQTLYGHPNEKLARERIKLAFASADQPLRAISTAAASSATEAQNGA